MKFCTLWPQGILQDETNTSEKGERKAENRSTYRDIFPYKVMHEAQMELPPSVFVWNVECGMETELDRVLLLGVSRAAPWHISFGFCLFRYKYGEDPSHA